MRKLIIALTIILTTIAYCGAEAPITKKINSSGNITVEQPDGLDAKLTPIVNAGDSTSVNEQATPAQPTSRAGFRVQVFDDNNTNTARQQAQSRKAMYESRFPEYRAYVSFNSPYWRVTVGDFKSRGQAEAAMADFKKAFPSQASHMRIIRARINTND